MSIPASWFIQILNMSLGAAWAALLVMAGRLLLRKAPKKFSYALWGIVLFRLVCPVSFSSVLSLMPRPQTIPQEIVYAAQPEIESGFQFFDGLVNQTLPPATPAASANPVQLWLELGNLLWQAGAVLMLAYGVISYLRFRGRLREAVLREGNVWESDRISTAFVMGFFRPRIYLPLGLGEEERRYILCHERTHIRRLDHLVKPLSFLLLCVHWFNPVLWGAYFLMCRDMEMSCDERVMETLGADIKKGYSTSLLAISERQSGLLTPLAFGENDVKSRIQNVLRYKKPALWVLVLALVLGAVLAFCLVANPMESWLPLSRQSGIPYHDAIWGESLRVEWRDAGSVELTDPDKVELLAQLISGLEVGKKPVPAGEEGEDWELRFTFRRPDGVGDFSLCFTQSEVWGEVHGDSSQGYSLKESFHLYQAVEENTFLTDPSQPGEYQVGFMEFREGQGQQYIVVTEPMVGSRLASLLLDGTQLAEKPGAVPPTGSYLFLNMGNPGTAYYIYELEGRYYVERPEDYRLELTQETYQSILDIWRTVAQREAPDETNGYYTGFEETREGERLRKFASYRGETATQLAALILGGADVPLDPQERVRPMDSYLRVEIREPGNAYYVYEANGRYYAEQPTNYRVELTEDSYNQIRNIYRDAAREEIVGEARSFYADGEMADIARVGIEGYYGAFTAMDIPEDLRILRFQVGEITPMAGTLEEFAVSFLWDYDTDEVSSWVSPNGNGVPIQGINNWRWTECYQEFRFRKTGPRLYQIVGIGTGGGGQGLAPITPEKTVQPQVPNNTASSGVQITQYYASGSLPLFAIEFAKLDEAAQIDWLNRIYTDNDVTFFSVALQTLADDDPRIDTLVEKAYLDGDRAFFSVAMNHMGYWFKEKWLDRALKDRRVDFQTILYSEMGLTGERDKAEAELDRQIAEEYAAQGITKNGKNYYYQGQRVNIFLDQRANRSAYTLDIDREGTLNLKVTRNAGGEIESVAPMTEAEAREIWRDIGEVSYGVNPDTSPNPSSKEEE